MTDPKIKQCIENCPDFCDFPTAWAIQKHAQILHDPECSSVPKEGSIAGPCFLCDCGAIEKEWNRIKNELKL